MSEVASKVYCSFCGKSQEEVRRLIVGPKAYICDECIKVCSEIVAEENQKEETARLRSEVPSPGEIEGSLDETAAGQDQETQRDLVQPSADEVAERDQQKQSVKHVLYVLSPAILSAWFFGSLISDRWLVFIPTFLVLAAGLAAILLMLLHLFPYSGENNDIANQDQQSFCGFLFLGAIASWWLASIFAQNWGRFIPLVILIWGTSAYLIELSRRLKRNGLIAFLLTDVRGYSIAASGLLVGSIMVAYFHTEAHGLLKKGVVDGLKPILILPGMIIVSCLLVLLLQWFLRVVISETDARVKVSNGIFAGVCTLISAVIMIGYLKTPGSASWWTIWRLCYDSVYNSLSFAVTGRFLLFGWLLFVTILLVFALIVFMVIMIIRDPPKPKLEKSEETSRLSDRLFIAQLTMAFSFVFLSYLYVFPSSEFGWTITNVAGPICGLLGLGLIFASMFTFSATFNLIIPSRRRKPRNGAQRFVGDIPTLASCTIVFSLATLAVLVKWFAFGDMKLFWDWCRAFYKPIVFW